MMQFSFHDVLQTRILWGKISTYQLIHNKRTGERGEWREDGGGGGREHEGEGGGRERGEGNEGRGREWERLGELVSHNINTQSSTPLSHTHYKF